MRRLDNRRLRVRHLDVSRQNVQSGNKFCNMLDILIILLVKEGEFLIIDMRTKNSIEYFLANYLNISVPELYSYVLRASENAQDDYSFNGAIFSKEVLSIVSSLNPQETIDEMYVYHLSRRLISDNMNNSSDNLKFLLTNSSPLSNFLKNHGVTLDLLGN